MMLTRNWIEIKIKLHVKSNIISQQTEHFQNISVCWFFYLNNFLNSLLVDFPTIRITILLPPSPY